MKVTPIPNTLRYRLEAETEADLQFMSDLDIDRHALRCADVHRAAVPGKVGVFHTVACVLDIDPKSPAALAAQAGRQCLGSLRQLGGLIFGQVPVSDGEPGAAEQPAEPETVTPAGAAAAAPKDWSMAALNRELLLAKIDMMQLQADALLHPQAQASGGKVQPSMS